MEGPAQFNVVIIGGGYAGVAICKSMLHVSRRVFQNTNTKPPVELEKQKGISVTLIDPKSGIYHSISAPRALVDHEYAVMAPVIVPYANLFHNQGVRHIQSCALAVDFETKMVYVAQGRIVTYDVLVIATGRTYTAPFRLSIRPDGIEKEELLAQLKKQREVLAAAPLAIVVGGGATGIETAAEIKTAFPNKQVRLVHSKVRKRCICGSLHNRY